MQAFEVADVLEERKRRAEAYHEFLRVPSVSCGIYHLAAGSNDPQKPHTEDELYYVLEGEATIHVDSDDRPVRPGSVVFVETGVEHRFHSIEKDLTVLVVFAPARGSRR